METPEPFKPRVLGTYTTFSGEHRLVMVALDKVVDELKGKDSMGADNWIHAFTWRRGDKVSFSGDMAQLIFDKMIGV